VRPVEETKERGPSTKAQKNRERFRELLARKKARKAANTSQQHRLEKHPSLPSTSSSAPQTPPTTTALPERMEVDPPRLEEATTSESSVGSTEPSRDVIDVFLNTPFLLPETPSMDDEEDPPFFKGTPPQSPSS
jgi:hypothetical protein